MKRLSSDKLKLIASMSIFGTIGIVRKNIPYPSSVIALVRGLVGMLFLLIFRLCRKEPVSMKVFKKNFLLLCASGILIGANWIFLFEAYQYTSVSVATMCYYMAPVIVILVSPLLLHETLTMRKGLCAAAAVCGMVLVSSVLESGVSGLRGVLLGLGAAAMYAAVILLNKLIHDLSASDRTLFQLGVAATALVPYVLLTEDLSTLETGPFIFIMLAVAGVVHTGIAYALYFGSIQNLPAQTVALFSYIDPIVAVLLSVLVLREPMTVSAALGVVLVIGATVVSEMEPAVPNTEEVR